MAFCFSSMPFAVNSEAQFGDALHCVDETDKFINEQAYKRLRDIWENSSVLKDEKFDEGAFFIRVTSCELFHAISLYPRAATDSKQNFAFVGHSVLVFLPRNPFLSFYEAPYFIMLN